MCPFNAIKSEEVVCLVFLGVGVNYPLYVSPTILKSLPDILLVEKHIFYIKLGYLRNFIHCDT
jgi:hypothetical protein